MTKEQEHDFGMVNIVTVGDDIKGIWYHNKLHIVYPGKGPLHTRLESYAHQQQPNDNPAKYTHRWEALLSALKRLPCVFEVEYVGEDGKVRDYLELRLTIGGQIKSFKL